ncbi:MAG TPA: shikimate dehydrogenase [Clostridiales bacterium]|nr:shikimate dehydrogenase [Clostridiales bacterium]
MQIQKYSVIGFPIGHTMSPFIHSRLFELSGIRAEYSVMEITPETLPKKFEELKQLAGFNITIPHKQAIIHFLDKLDGSAAEYGAVNTVKCSDITIGYNTDAFGFIKALDIAGIKLNGSVAICGCGGVARTIAYKALQAGCQLTFAVRESDMGTARLLKSQLEGKFEKAKIDVCPLEDFAGQYSLLINATPVGMHPNSGEMPVSIDQLRNCSAVFDAVYNPGETMLLKNAKALGLKTVGGMPMLVWQAVKAHEIWYNASFRLSDIESLIEEADAQMQRRFNNG